MTPNTSDKKTNEASKRLGTAIGVGLLFAGALTVCLLTRPRFSGETVVLWGIVLGVPLALLIRRAMQVRAYLSRSIPHGSRLRYSTVLLRALIWAAAISAGGGAVIAVALSAGSGSWSSVGELLLGGLLFGGFVFLPAAILTAALSLIATACANGLVRRYSACAPPSSGPRQTDRPLP